jgi:hypothetical protein
VTWDAGDGVLRVTLRNGAAAPTGHLVLGVGLRGAARFDGPPSGCRLVLPVGAATSCALAPIPAGGSVVVEVPVAVTGPGASARVDLCEVGVLSLTCGTGVLESTTVALT